MKRICFGLACCGLLAGLLLTTGCASKDADSKGWFGGLFGGDDKPKEQKITAWSVRRNMSPELATMNDSGEQQWNRIFRSADTNLRHAQEDVYRLLMIDEPDKMGKIPVP